MTDVVEQLRALLPNDVDLVIEVERLLADREAYTRFWSNTEAARLEHERVLADREKWKDSWLELQTKVNGQGEEIERLQTLLVHEMAAAQKAYENGEQLRALLREAANEIDELGFPSKADKFLSALVTLEPEP